MGVFKNGVIAERQADLFAKVADDLQESGVWGAKTVLDAPDEFASDPLVQLTVAFTAGLAQCWQAVEFVQSQADPAVATGTYLDEHLARYGITSTGTDLDKRAALEYLKGTTPYDIEQAAMLTTGVKFAKRIDYNGKDMLVLHGQFTAGELAKNLRARMPDGVYDLIGDNVDTYNCASYRWQNAVQIFIGLKIYVIQDVCAKSTVADLINSVVDGARCAYYGKLGVNLTGAMLMQFAQGLEGISVDRIELTRFGPELVIDCTDDVTPITTAECGGEPYEYINATTSMCEFGGGEIHCDNPVYTRCLQLKPWEFAGFSVDYVDVTGGEVCT